MLCLKSSSHPEFVARFEAHPAEMMLDHAHCEKKAASTALSLIFRYPDYPELVRKMSTIVEEEIQHFGQVLNLMETRGWSFARLKPSAYAGRLSHLVRTAEPDAFIDRMLMCALIEARSCERFSLLGEHLSDPELRAYYAGLFESEARHYMTYVRLASDRFGEAPVRVRLEELARSEAEIIATAEGTPRIHA